MCILWFCHEILLDGPQFIALGVSGLAGKSPTPCVCLRQIHQDVNVHLQHWGFTLSSAKTQETSLRSQCRHPIKPPIGEKVTVHTWNDGVYLSRSGRVEYFDTVIFLFAANGDIDIICIIYIYSKDPADRI